MKAPNRANRNEIRRKSYQITFQIGLIITLLIFIGLFRIDFYPESEPLEVVTVQEIVQMEEIEITRQEITTPPPPRPQVPVAVPNDEIIADDIVLFDAELNIGDALTTTAPPPPPKMDEEEEEEEQEIFVIVEQMPQLIGGIASVQNKIRYPEMARRAGIEGRVMVQFVIDEEGNVHDPVVVRGIGGGCDEEAVRAVKEAKFIPGMQRGRPVKVRYTLPINFQLAEQSR